jgi:hypothetical protein
MFDSLELLAGQGQSATRRIAARGCGKKFLVIPGSADTDTRSQRSFRRGTLALALVLVFAVVAVAVVRSRDTPKTVGVVGDSITFFAGRDISASLGDGYHADVQSGIGRRIDEMLPELRAVVRRNPYAVLVNLGTNDALEAASHPDWRTGVDDLVAVLAPTRCALLTTVYTDVGGDPAAVPVAADINTSIAVAAAAHPNFHIVDWNAAVHGPNGGGLLVPDHIHPSSAGQLVLASLDRAALQHDCR